MIPDPSADTEALNPGDHASSETAHKSAPEGGQGTGPGETLRESRIGRGIDRLQVADHLNLHPDLIDAIERNAWERLPGAVYISGYLRGYARFLGMDPEPLIEAFRQQQPSAPGISPTRAATSLPQRQGQSRLLLWVLIGALVVALAFGLQHLLTHFGIGSDPETPVPEARVIPAPAFDASSRPESAVMIAPQTERGPRLDEDHTDAALPETNLLEGDELDLLQSPDVEWTRIELPESDTAASDSDTVARVSPIDSPTAAPPIEAPDTEAVTETTDELPEGTLTEPSVTTDLSAEFTSATSDSAPSELVELVFTGDCWVDVRDGAMNSLLTGVMNAGDRYQLSGPPPYSLVFGRASTVRLTVGGQAFDLAPYTERGVARLTLDEADLARDARGN